MSQKKKSEELKSWGVQYQGSMWHQQKLATERNGCHCLRCNLQLNPSNHKKWLRLVGFTFGSNTPPSILGDDVGVIIEACPFCSANYYMHIDQKGLEAVKTNPDWQR